MMPRPDDALIGLTDVSHQIDSHWDTLRDVIDNLIDVMLNYRQSGHPGGSRSKTSALLSLLLGGWMRWDIRRPEARFADRFILSAGHTVPLVYATLAVFNEAMRRKWHQTGDPRYRLASPEQVLTWEDLLGFRRRGGLSGHAEMAGKTRFLKFNTGPSGHGSTAAVGQALALQRAGAGEVKVFAIEGEGGLTPGANYEAMNSAWGLALDNLIFLVDWNDFGIDDHPVSASVSGSPSDWFEAHGWRTFGTEEGHSWQALLKVIQEAARTPNADRAPTMLWFKTRKGIGYLKYDAASHGSPHSMNCDLFWETKRPFMEKYNVLLEGIDRCAPTNEQELAAEFRANIKAIVDVVGHDESLVDYLADRLISIAETVPDHVPTFSLGRRGNPFHDSRLYDPRQYPDELYVQPGTKVPNRAALAKWGAWVNAFGRLNYDRPLVLAASADLAGSTNISGFAEPFGDSPGYGWYERFGTSQGVLLPQEITEFANSGIMAGLAALNFSPLPEEDFDGFWGACSTYGSFSYLKYGMFRLFSQLAQDSEWKVGKVIWVVGHSGPETADDSRTHFGIFSPGVTQLFPRGQIVNLHPWEHNEVPVVLAASLRLPVPLVALHLTRPPIEVPDRRKLGIPSHFEAARGAYVIRDYDEEHPKTGAVIVQGTSAVASALKCIDSLRERCINVKIVCAVSWELFSLQPSAYQDSVLTPADRLNSMVVSTQAGVTLSDWMFCEESKRYSVCADWDNRWRTGGTLDEILDEAHLSPHWVLSAIERFASEYPARMTRLLRAIT